MLEGDCLFFELAVPLNTHNFAFILWIYNLSCITFLMIKMMPYSFCDYISECHTKYHSILFGFRRIWLFFFNGNLTKFLISPLILTTQKKADHILEKSRLGVFCVYCFKNHTCESRLTTECSK